MLRRKKRVGGRVKKVKRVTKLKRARRVPASKYVCGRKEPSPDH
jgi:hypothetical protein